MSMRKRALSSTSSDQPSQTRRPGVAPIGQEWNGSKRKLEPMSCLMEEDGQSEVREELELAESDWAECYQRANAKSTAKHDDRNLQLQPQTKRLRPKKPKKVKKRKPQTKLPPPVFSGKNLEAERDAFPVKNFRREAYSKHNPLASDNEVRRIENIGKSNQKPSIERYTENDGMSYKLGNEAEICETHSKYHLYCPDGMSNYGVAFNDAWKLINLFKDGRWFHAARLSANEEEYGEEIMRKAFTHWKDVMVFSGGRARAVEDMQSFMSETSNGSDLFPKSFLIEEVIGKVVRKQLELVESCIVKRFREELELVESRIVKQIREELELGKPNLADLVESRIRNTLKEELVPKICSSLEDTSRRVVREELAHASSQSAQLVRSSGKCRKEDEVRNLQLQFKTRLSLPLFTGQKLEGEHGAPIVVVLINANTGDIVQSGPESSVKLDVVVLDGDFKKEDADYWTEEEFKKYVVKEREGKRPLLTGNLEVILKGGTGVLGELEFTDNSSWNRSKKFRLGLRVSPGYCDNVHVCEAKTEAFTVKEHRGESYKKHYPPASDDDVWRLANIAKDGSSRKRLNEAGIYKVEEFLRQLSMDSKKLRSILGKGMTDKKWKVLLDHAKNCTLNGKLYVYYHDNGSNHGVIFNNVGQLTGLTANGMFCAIDRFSLQQKDYADRLVKKAYENWNDVRQFDAEASSSSVSEKISCSLLTEVLGDQQCCRPVHDNVPTPQLASQVGLKVPPRSSALTVEGNSGITAARLPTQSQSLNSQNAPWNQSIDCINQMEPSAGKNAQPFGQVYESPSRFPAFDIEDDGIDWLLPGE